MGIRIEEDPGYDKDRYQIDESRLEEALDAKVHYGSDGGAARKHDTDCLSAIHRLRKGKSLYRIEECKAIFVTSNTAVCQAGNAYFVEEGYIARGSVSTVVIDHSLTTLLWLKKPMAAPHLARKSIIAGCYAAMEPGTELRNKYLSKIRQLRDRGEVSSEEYFVLRQTQEARTELMDATVGDSGAFVDGTPEEILRRVVDSRTEEDRFRLAAETQRREEAEREARLAEEKRGGRQEESVRDADHY